MNQETNKDIETPSEVSEEETLEIQEICKLDDKKCLSRLIQAFSDCD
jgi:hypothetical protein